MLLTSEAGLEISLKEGRSLSVAVLLPEKFLTHTGPARDGSTTTRPTTSPCAVGGPAAQRQFSRAVPVRGLTVRGHRQEGRARPWGGLGGGAGSPQTLHPPGLLLSSQGRAERLLLLTYDSKVLVENFRTGLSANPTFLPLFPEEAPRAPARRSAAARPVWGRQFLQIRRGGHGSLSVGNASAVALSNTCLACKSLQPGEGDGAGGGEVRAAPGAGTRPARLVTARAVSSGLMSVPGPLPSGVLWLAGPARQRTQAG